MDALAAIASTLLGSGNVDGARRIAERMLALASHIVAVHPDEPAAHLALSAAYRQIYKNAYPMDDQEAVEANMNLAINAAERALLLDRDSDKARNAVDDLQRRLADRHSNDRDIRRLFHRR